MRWISNHGTESDGTISPFPKQTQRTIQADFARLLERALQSAGHDFYADPIWDACLTYERQHGSLAGLLEAYKQVVNIPLFHYARYFNDFRAIAVQAPLEALEPTEVIADLQATVQKELGQAEHTEVMAALRNKVDQKYWDNFQKLQEEVNNRWQWEQHVGKDGGSKLDESTRISMWKDYLDYEENKGDYVAVRALYERCLLFNSTQTQFWYRYVRWLTARPDKEEETRNVYRRVSSIFAPIYDPAIRLSWAKFEEAFARPSVAAEIYEAVLDELPDDLSTHASLTMLCRRQQGLDAAIRSLDTRADRAKILPNTRGALVVEKAKLLWRETSDAQAARHAFVQNQKALTDVATFWYGWLSFEIDQPARRNKTHVPDRARSIYQTMQQMANLTSSELQGLSALYMQYLDERGDSSSIAELVELDAYVNGPMSLRSTPGATNAPTVLNGQGG